MTFDDVCFNQNRSLLFTLFEFAHCPHLSTARCSKVKFDIQFTFKETARQVQLLEEGVQYITMRYNYRILQTAGQQSLLRPFSCADARCVPPAVSLMSLVRSGAWALASAQAAPSHPWVSLPSMSGSKPAVSRSSGGHVQVVMLPSKMSTIGGRTAFQTQRPG